ncbi:MAG TPA: ribonuclease III [Balneola sp.]|jgi:ribonuclease-3|nr:ribonuclease III [Balneola sp.]MAO76710.1 ribonuclease III [Balneola sp.]MBF65117.1 ribonuclease III [Balneola sp.]HAH51416.1 ribonuclease III [Balneola sp.]HBZ39963.1 ribonuclease III [Balneola sp.]|tara:strand:- start:106 stop:852 length:747 start_codon:yes stop_codon:yes gene_type:complete
MPAWLRSLFKKKDQSKDQVKNERLLQLERIIGLKIDDPSLFLKALRHRSTLANDQYSSHDSYERLEFLGDAVLDLIAAEVLFEKFPTANEGFLTKSRAKLVKGETLAKFSEELGIEELLELGERSEQLTISKSILADVFESIIAAIYITKGYPSAFLFVSKVFEDQVDFQKLVNQVDNFKSALLEFTQAEKMSLPDYKVISESGPGHDKVFEIMVYVDNKELGVGHGRSKKIAEQAAAKVALKTLGVR